MHVYVRYSEINSLQLGIITFIIQWNLLEKHYQFYKWNIHSNQFKMLQITKRQYFIFLHYFSGSFTINDLVLSLFYTSHISYWFSITETDNVSYLIHSKMVSFLYETLNPFSKSVCHFLVHFNRHIELFYTEQCQITKILFECISSNIWQIYRKSMGI